MRYKAFLLFVLSLFLSVGCTENSKKGGFAGQIIPVSDSLLQAKGADTIRFGLLSEGEVARKRVSLHNISSSPLVLLSHKTTCGCVRLDYERKPFTKDESLPIDITFDSRGEWGWQMKLVTIYLGSESEPLRLYIEAEVE